MPDNEARLQLVCYDIREPGRLRRVHRCMLAWGVPVQYSVFLSRLARRQVDAMTAELEALIDKRVDDLRIYPLPANPRALAFGRSCFPDGVSLVEQGNDLLALGSAA